LSELQAAVLLPQLQILNQQNCRRALSVQLLQSAFADSPAISLLLTPEFRSTPITAAGMATASFYKTALLMNCHQQARNELSQACLQQQIPLHPGFSALHTIHAKSRFTAPGSLENATLLSQQLLTLHHSVLLLPPSELLQMAGEIRRLAELRQNVSW
jgi:dTDP-4-amino-4,6-dideoxygalactose transaminase